MSETKLVRSYHAHGAAPLQLRFDSAAPVTGDGTAQSKIFMHEADLVVQALIETLPGGLLNAILAVMLYRVGDQALGSLAAQSYGRADPHTVKRLTGKTLAELDSAGLVVLDKGRAS